MSLDKLAADVAALDPRLRIATDEPECFLCGHRIRRTAFDPLTVDTANSIGLHAHSMCVSNMSAFEIMARYWQAIRAAIVGENETPNPGKVIISSGSRQ